MSNKTILVWYRNDLRIHDHQALTEALKQNSATIIPVYCFDKRHFQTTSFGFPKTGKFRAKFLIESVANLRESLQNLSTNLVVRYGLPEEVITQLAEQYKVTDVYFSEEATAEELLVENNLKKSLSHFNVNVNSFWQSTLYHPHNLPFSLSEIPELFTNFRKQVEKKSNVDSVLPTPTKLPQLPENIEIGKIPSLTELGLEEFELNSKAVLQFQGGETEGIKRLNDYFWRKDCLQNYKETRNGMLGANYSSKFSPWLALGCLSPRFIYEKVKKYEAKRVKNNSTYWLIFELLWRDFFRFICVKHGNKVFYKSGLQGLNIKWKEDKKRFDLWCEGKTGYPLVDANMRELKSTGFVSNRGRQNVASFLTKNLGINWQMGAEWFEYLLIDYDVCSNWGNWNYTAGVGNDARGFRYFNIPKQSQNYDSKGNYLRHWLPEISNIKGDKIHQPWLLSKDEQKNYNVQIGVDYPHPIVDFFNSIKANEKIYLYSKF